MSPSSPHTLHAVAGTVVLIAQHFLIMVLFCCAFMLFGDMMDLLLFHVYNVCS